MRPTAHDLFFAAVCDDDTDDVTACPAGASADPDGRDTDGEPEALTDSRERTLYNAAVMGSRAYRGVSGGDDCDPIGFPLDTAPPRTGHTPPFTVETVGGGE